MTIDRKVRRDRQNGYSVNYQQLYIAYLIEAGIIGASLYAAYEFAGRYVANEPVLYNLAIVGAISIALAETGRVLMAKAICTQRQIWKKALAAIGVLMCIVVTTKAMSQVTEQIYSPRLLGVIRASDDLAREKSELAILITEKAGKADRLKPLAEDVDRLDKQVTELAATAQGIGEAPKAYTVKESYAATCRNKKGQAYKCTKTRSKMIQPDYAGKPVLDQMNSIQGKRAAAVEARTAAAKLVAESDVAIAEQQEKVTQSEGVRREAVMNSQLHSFTAMVFGKDPTEVNDAEVHSFLRFFVLVAAAAIAISSTILVVTAYHPLPTKPQPKPVNKKVRKEVVMSPTLENHVRRIATMSNKSNVTPIRDSN